MHDFSLVPIAGELPSEEKKILVDGLIAHHANNGYPRKSETFSILLKNKNKKTVGAVIVSFLWNGMEIQSLWIDESIRKQGWGRKLIQVVEEEAKKRGCAIAYTNTFSWQAPEFYEKLGYKLYGKLEDFPKGKTLHYYSKKLT